MIKHIQAGELNLQFSQGEERLDELIGFASRENQKRGFLFVSKVLGKHIPVKPSVMRGVYNELAELCAINNNSYVIGMAETATGLGAGLADSLARKNSHLDVFYQHTTRHQLSSDVWFTLDEVHSHAVDHILYRPNQEVYTGIQSCQTLILVDDEMTTGRTMLQLAAGILERVENIQELIIVTLVSWLDDDKKQIFNDFPVPVRFVQLLKGHFTFQADANFSASLPENVDDGVCYEDSRDDLGRTALKMPYDIDPDSIPNHSDQPVVVVGTGEHLYYPFLVAEQMENGQIQRDVLFQSTTRSPILKGDAIRRKISFNNGQDKVNFIYNLPMDRDMLVICESDALEKQNGLLNGQLEES